MIDSITNTFIDSITVELNFFKQDFMVTEVDQVTDLGLEIPTQTKVFQILVLLVLALT